MQETTKTNPFFDFKIIVILGLIIAILIMRSCKGTRNSGDLVKPVITVDGKKYKVLKQKVDTFMTTRDSIVYRKGKDIYHETVIHDRIPTNADTIAIIDDYFNKRIYHDTLKLADSIGTVTIADSISQNRLIGRVWHAKVHKYVINNTTIVKDLPKSQLYFGLNMGFDKTSVVNYAGPALLLKTKADHVYSVGVGYSSDKTISIQGGIYWKIKLKD
jgi:hypothetical protein